MHDTPLPEPPAWVYKRDGRLVPFEADKISRALFAATEARGRPDAFLARELADGVVHFLADENDGTPPTTAQLAELVVKVVRELGQPALAETFAEFARRREQTRLPGTPQGNPQDEPPQGPPVPRSPGPLVTLSFPAGAPLADVLAACTRGYTLQAVFTRDLVAAQDAGLITLTGLETPDRLAGCVLGPPVSGGDLTAAVEEAHRRAGSFVALDAPEHWLAVGGKADEAGADELVGQLSLGLRLTGLYAVVNLNSAAPPPWADELAGGPLFAGRRRPGGLASLRDRLASAFLGAGGAAGRVRVDWHLSERDFDEAGVERLGQLARRALGGVALGFVIDRPRRAVPLAEGADRQHPAVLIQVGLHLPRLAEQPGIDGDPERFLHKLGSLARLALSAAVQKRDYLRRQDRARPAETAGVPAVTSGFLLDRARLVVVPVGLDAVVQRLLRRGLSAGGAALELSRRVVQRLRDVLRQDGRAAHLDTCIDGPFDFRLGAAGPEDGPWPAGPRAAGLTAWEAAAPPKAQVRAAGVLHAVAEGGTLALFVPGDHPPAVEEVVGWLRAAWQQAEVTRVRLVRGLPAPRQLTFGHEPA
jgi:hypothetical protein